MSYEHGLAHVLALEYLGSRLLHFMQDLHEDTGNAYQSKKRRLQGNGPCVFADYQKEGL